MNELNIKTVEQIAGITSKRVILKLSIYELNNRVALTPLNTSVMQDYLDYELYSGMFMSVLLFPLMAVYGDTSEIHNSEACLYASLYIIHFCMKYYKDKEAYAAIVHSLED